MNSRNLWQTAVALVTLSMSAPALAVSYGAFTRVVNNSFTSDGGEFILSASTTESDSDGNGAAMATLDGTSLLPILRAQSFSSGNGARVSAEAVGYQSYEYMGTDPTTITLNFTSEGILNYSGDQFAVIESEVGVVLGGVPDGLFTFDLPTLFFEELAFGIPGVSVVDYQTLAIFDGGFPNGFSSVSGSIEIMLNPGDIISVVASVQTIARDGASADAFNTLTMSFSDDSNLRAIGVVPVPGAVWLLGSGLIGLFGLKRKSSIA